uniref:2-isopropylmalate synthase n=1 Tax=Timspurckia oligopyrenoides TaxID=708627 RepID=A0A7S0ZLH0_9RHOD|mmetsp:Transcript_9885/g.17809  ORF Transcript_9885/g.17809 Transcript_9885/m.17809 type:complete len:634 (+) Transcript_9885:133-2034(+)|eukprot:CAMPEP_0182444372 /NCGR_PEP_ID=MMETSP1172-20130603/2840_1 /TAXON_ID=708627 /ORGANISM="Timspurckia oligopyrenoides, Strain CCMP3278" /LENGTH=633 /DNA_ID=CAMNT_0024639911 /DNA_START=118 /DNA_END=2019 /DNA_ORIENTATION=-
MDVTFVGGLNPICLFNTSQSKQVCANHWNIKTRTPMKQVSVTKKNVIRCSTAASESSVTEFVAKDSIHDGNTQKNLTRDVVPVQTRHDLVTKRDPKRVKIFDTTLRDGEQSPGATLNHEEKLIIARQLAKLGVDVIEAGFPVASEGDFLAVQSIASTVGNLDDPPIICGLARAMKKDIERCYEAVKPAAFPRIHTFIATSDVHMEHKLRKTREEVLAITKEMVSYARSLCEDVEFSAEDATRSDHQFLYEVYSVAIEAGASTINVPDTVGFTTPAEIGALIKGIRANVRGVENVTISVHGHDDLGMAVANFMSAIENGCRQVECTINGIGERAGNAALEELVMAMYVRKSYYNGLLGRPENGMLTNINHAEIYSTSRMVSNLTGMLVQPNKAIVGSNAFAHESGIHQDGILKNRLTYEIMDAKSIGLNKNSLVLGKHSGRHAFRTRLVELGYELPEEELNHAFIRFKELADKKKDISDLDLESIVGDEMKNLDQESSVKLDLVQVVTGNQSLPSATVRLALPNGEFRVGSSVGTGPVDASFKAVEGLLSSIQQDQPLDVKLEEYIVQSVTAGIDALGEIMVRVRDLQTNAVVTGSASNTDIVVASTQAYLIALNRVLSNRLSGKRVHPQMDNN